jgi:polar amino acid transport system substrate-binding protein
MIRNFLCCIVLFLIHITPGFLIAQELPTQALKIKVVTEDTFPIQYLEKGQVLGPATDLVKSVLAEAGLPYSIEVLPWARAYNIALNEPNTMIYSLARTEQREGLFQWIGSVMRLNYYLVGMESLKLSQPITLESLKKFISRE